MASAQTAVMPMCNGCDVEEARWFCEDCLENLCDLCKQVHQKFRKTKNDTILPIRDVQIGSKRKIVPILCETHKSKLYELYCKNCEQLICAQCLSSSHTTHEFESVESFIDTKTNELDKFEQKFESKFVYYDTLLASESKEHAGYMSHVDLLKEEVRGQADKIVQEVYKLRDEQLSEVSALQKEEERRHQSASSDFHSRKTEIRRNVQCVQKAKVSGNAAVIIQVLEESMQTYQAMKDPTPSTLRHPMLEHEQTFQSSLLLLLAERLKLPTKTPSAMKELDINNVKVIFSTKIENKTGSINAIIPTENNMAWIAVDPDNHLSLTNTKGEVIKESVEVRGKIYFAVSYRMDILVVHEKGHCVMRYSNDGDSVTIFSNLSPFYTNRLCVTSQQDVMVSLVSVHAHPRTSKIVRLDRRGQVLQEIQYRNQEPLFAFARSLTSLPNGDLVVVDNVAKDVWRVICVDERGNYRYTWNGEAIDTSPICLTRMTHNGQKVYITDRKNHRMYVLDRDGKAEQFMLDKLGITQPWAISMDNRGRMWLGCISHIYVLE